MSAVARGGSRGVTLPTESSDGGRPVGVPSPSGWNCITTTGKAGNDAAGGIVAKHTVKAPPVGHPAGHDDPLPRRFIMSKYSSYPRNNVVGEDAPNPWIPEMERRMESITSALALRAAHYLARICRHSDATVKVSQARIAADLNSTTEGVRKALGVLRDAGLISWTNEHRQASTYRLLYLMPSDAEERGHKAGGLA